MDNVWSGYQNSKYNLGRTDGFNKEITTSNHMETFHNLLKEYVGIHSSFYSFHDGIVDLENEYVIRYVQLLIHKKEPRRRKYYVQRDAKLKEVYNMVKEEISKHNNDFTKMKLSFWIKWLQVVRNILYPVGGKKKGQTENVNMMDLILDTTIDYNQKGMSKEKNDCKDDDQ